MNSSEFRDRVVRQIPVIATKVKRDVRDMWGDLYREFGYLKNVHFSRIAYTQDKKTIDVIEEEGHLEEFAKFVEGYLKEETPASPEKEKAPVQGSLL